jgi:hypothetical protein
MRFLSREEGPEVRYRRKRVAVDEGYIPPHLHPRLFLSRAMAFVKYLQALSAPFTLLDMISKRPEPWPRSLWLFENALHKYGGDRLLI